MDKKIIQIVIKIDDAEMPYDLKFPVSDELYKIMQTTDIENGLTKALQQILIDAMKKVNEV